MLFLIGLVGMVFGYQLAAITHTAYRQSQANKIRRQCGLPTRQVHLWRN